MKQRIREQYNKETRVLSAEQQKRKARIKWFITAEVASFAIAVALTTVFFTGYIGAILFIFLFSLAVAIFVAVKAVDRINGNNIEKAEARLSVYRKNIMYLNGDFSVFDDGKRYENTNHQYTYDLDVFGKESLYNRICQTVTTGGSDRLAEILATSGLQGNGQPDIREIKKRNRAIAELAGREDWRTEFLAAGSKEKIDTHLIKKVLQETRDADIPQHALSGKWLTGVVASISIFAVLLLLTLFTPMNADFICIWTVIQLGASINSSAKAIKMITKSTGKISKSTKACLCIMRLVSEAKFNEEDNKRVVEALNGNGNAALKSMKEMKGIVDALDRRANVLGLVIFNAVGWSDFFLVRRYLKWQQQNMSLIEEWIDALSEIDAMVSMATMRYNEPQSIDAEIVDSDDVVFEAKNLYHPFLGDKAVKNDFSIKDRNYYIITGANMAGKSTFLRSVGINYILAMCGMPVFADSLTVSIFSLFSSMRTSDDLAHGISYFNAELLRLKLLLQNVNNNTNTLIILDEILKGTNSLDKLNGSRMFLEAVAKLPVTGIIATHDLELSKMAEEYPSRFHNFCFEIKLANNISYSYKITPGVAQNQNATFLLKGILQGAKEA